MGSQEDCKYAHLLQPIRDLAANWDINIASELEEYLGVLEHITFSFDGGPTLNFAEAALLIQGSACVYSKKVEHLHGLVHQALSYISDKRKRGSQEAQAQEDALDEFDDEETFLNLDDTLQEGTGIDLDEGHAASHEHPPRPPAALLALEETGAGQGEGCSTSYRIATCAMHKSGALLLEASDGDVLDVHLRRTEAAAGPSQTLVLLGDGLQEPQGADAPHEEHDGMEDHYDPGDGFGGDDGYDDGHNAQEQPCAPLEKHADCSGAPAWLQDEEGQGQARQARGAKGAPEPKEVFDPYKPLDPHDPGGMPLRPFRKVKPRRRKRAPKAPVQDVDLFAPPAPAGPSALSFSEFGYVLRARREAERAERAQLRSAAVREAEGSWGAGWDEACSGAAEPVSAFEGAEGQDGLDEGYPDDGGYGGDDGGDGFVDDYDDVAPDMEDLAQAADAGLQPRWDAAGGADTAQLGEGASYEDKCRAHIEALMAAAAAAEVQTELAARVASWRAKMDPALAEQDARGDFDIHEYGAVILQDLAQLSLKDASDAREPEIERVQPVAFEEVAQKPHAWQVSRLFSALLQLANAGNLVIVRTANSPAQPFALQLRSLDPAHAHFSDYRAPSFLQAKDTNAQPAAVAEDGAKEQPAVAKPAAARKPAKRRKAKT